MNRTEQEISRNMTFVSQLKSATSIKELPPKITKGAIVDVLRKITRMSEYYDSRETFLDMAQRLIEDKDYLTSQEFKDDVKEYLTSTYGHDRNWLHEPARSESEIAAQTEYVVNNERLANKLHNIWAYDEKYNQFEKENRKLQHDALIARIKSAKTIGELPSGGISKINQEIATTLYKIFNKEKLKVEYTGKIAAALLDGKTLEDIVVEEAILKLVREKEITGRHNSMSDLEKIHYVQRALKENYEIPFLVEEIKAKETRIKEIYKIDHDEVMQQIALADRISNMPTGLSISKITSYLSGNSVIYPRGKQIDACEFVVLAANLLMGKKFDDEAVELEIKKIAENHFESDPLDARILLMNKLSRLPRLDYYIDEVKYAESRRQEFIKKGASNVNVYFVPNPDEDPGKGLFYNCYISRKDETLELEKIIPEGLEVNDIEDYVKEKVDDSFKLAGGIIVARDESIGGVNIFRPSGGPVGISKEEKENSEKLEELSKLLSETLTESNKMKEDYEKQFSEIQANYAQAQDKFNEKVKAIQEKIDKLISGEDKNKKENKSKKKGA